MADPFSYEFTPVDHDPFDIYSDPRLQSALASKGPEQRPARLDILRDALTPSYLRDTPSSPQADIALSDPNAKPGKIGPPSGPPTTLEKMGGFAADVASGLAPELKGMVALKGMAGALPGAVSLSERIANLEQSLGRKLRPDLTEAQVASLEKGTVSFKSTRNATKYGTPQKGSYISAEEWIRRNPEVPENEPLQRQVIERGRSGRPIETAPLPIGNENAILEAGAKPNYPALLQAHGPEFQNASIIDHQGNVLHNPLSGESVGGPMLRINEDGSVTRGILAYHGSPHDFERFDLSKIGTGEGAQAYGHGLYFAENEGVAKSYRDALREKEHLVGDEPMDLFNPLHEAAFRLHEHGGNRIAALRDLEDMINESYDPVRSKAADLLASDADIPSVKYNPGRMYQVSINADPEHFLDWDKPLSEQTPHVQRIIRQLIPPPDEGQWVSHNGIHGLRSEGSTYNDLGVVTEKNGRFHALSDAREGTFDSLDEAKKFIERYAQSAMKNIVDSLAGEHLYRGLEDTRQGAADRLRAAGIPGIKYLDQGSRAGGEGTRNYVVFSDDLIKILRKYGIAGLTTAGAAHFSTTPVDHDPFE